MIYNMTERDLVKQLKTLKSVKLDSAWKEANRELLYTQISNSGVEIKETFWMRVSYFSQSFARVITRPAIALGALVIVLVSSVFFTNFFSGSKPNNSLYIARVISEKAKLNITFDKEDRDKQAVQFAAEHASEISNILADPSYNKEDNQEEVAKLHATFKKEISVAKSKLAPVVEEPVFSAGTGKEEDGLEVFDPTVAASSSQQILEEAEKLFSEENYSAAKEKLDQILD
jgi:hypothetical protein